ncbi:MAG: polyprenyl synthetase family protein [Myxococcota bacterium]
MTTKIDDALVRALEAGTSSAPPKLAEAMRYAVFPGGARVRPRLCLAVAEAAAGAPPPPAAIGLACSLELLHCASLVHDDLPCFDDADLRRGRPSVHRAFGEALALLVGDGLMLLALDTVATGAIERPRLVAPLVSVAARAAGASEGLVAGQGWESEPEVDTGRYHRAKTGALFVAATTGGALTVGADASAWADLGLALGEAYQVADDLLDAHAAPAEAGKPVGQDQTRRRPSAVHALGTEGALAELRRLIDRAVSAVPVCPGQPELRVLVEQMAVRLVPSALRRSAA